MKIYKCDGCLKPCFLQVNDNASHPYYCPYSTKSEWHEVKEETTTKTSQLPDWVKECAIGYDNEQERYFEVTNVDKKWVDIEYLDDGIGATWSYGGIMTCTEARKRPFNDKEMQALVGKVIDNEHYLLLVYGFEKKSQKIFFGNVGYYSAEHLANNGYTIDGKPCYKLEHLENGEWVE